MITKFRILVGKFMQFLNSLISNCKVNILIIGGEFLQLFYNYDDGSVELKRVCSYVTIVIKGLNWWCV
jgi:hypothetical protein